MTDATLYRAATTPEAVATIEAITGYNMSRPMLGAIHEPPIAFGSAIHRQALPFGTREGDLVLVLGGAAAATRADAIDAALKLNGLYYLSCPHFPQLHQMRFAVAGPYRVEMIPQRGRNTWTLMIPIKEVLT